MACNELATPVQRPRDARAGHAKGPFALAAKSEGAVKNAWKTAAG